MARVETDAILLSIRNLDNCLYPNTIEYVTHNVEVVKIIKSAAHCPLIAGGIAIRLGGSELIDALDVDWGYMGRASNNMIVGIERIIRNENVDGVDGFVKKGSLYHPKEYEYDGYGVDYHIYERIDIKSYLRSGGVIGIQTKYGCDLNCIYCTYPIIEGKKIVCYAPEQIVDTIEYLKKTYDINFFEFADSTFNYPAEHAKEIMRLMIKRKIDVGWSAFISPKNCDCEFLELCKMSGCTGIDFGVDSGSDKMLAALRKAFTSKDIVEASNIASRLDLAVCYNLVLGGPGEDEKTLEESFSLFDRYKNSVVSAYSAIRIYKGTELEKIAREEGKVNGSLLYPQFYISDNIVESVNNILMAHRKAHPTWMLRGITKPPSIECIKRFGLNRKSPLWTEKVKKYNGSSRTK